MNATNFEDWFAICEVSARCCRFRDTKQWDSWTALFTGDFVLDTSEAGGGPPITGQTNVVAMVRGSIESAETAHQVHNSEIVFAGDTAEVIRAMQDRLAFASGHGLVGSGHYTKTYVKQSGAWKIARSKLTRLHLDLTTPAQA